MIEKFLNDVVIKTALNKALELDPQAAEKLAPLEGKRIAIKLNFRDAPWIFVIHDEQLEIDNLDMVDCDVKLTGSIAGFLQLFRQSSGTISVNDKLYIEGDLHAAQQFQRVMSELSPDFDYSFKKYFGPRLGGILSESFEQIKQLGTKAQQDFAEKLKRYLSDETTGCLKQSDFHTYKQRLSSLRLTLDRLEAKVAILGNDK